jgi:hypothetical protein
LWSALPPARTNFSLPRLLNVAILPGTGVVSTAADSLGTQVVFVTSNAFNVCPWISNTFPYPWLRQTPSIDGLWAGAPTATAVMNSTDRPAV